MSKRRPLLTDRDRIVLPWIGEQYAVRVDHLQWLMGRYPGRSTKEPKEPGKVTATNIERRVKRWIELGLVEREKQVMGEPAWVYLTKQGLIQSNLAYRYRKPRTIHQSVIGNDNHYSNHIYWANHVRLYVENRQAARGLATQWRSERQLRFEWGKDEATKDKHVPDAEIIMPNGVVALEIELTQKDEKRFDLILRELARNYSAIWYFVSEKTADFVWRRIQELPTEQPWQFTGFSLETTDIANPNYSPQLFTFRPQQ